MKKETDITASVALAIDMSCKVFAEVLKGFEKSDDLKETLKWLRKIEERWDEPTKGSFVVCEFWIRSNPLNYLQVWCHFDHDKKTLDDIHIGQLDEHHSLYGKEKFVPIEVEQFEPSSETSIDLDDIVPK